MTDGVNGIAGTQGTSLYAGSKPAAAPKQEMDRQTFLTLLVAQLRNQDPSSPMDTNEMMAQSTQLATVEKLTDLADTSRESFALQMRVAASGMVGQQVSVLDKDGKEHTGIATAVSFKDETPTVTVDGLTVTLDKVSAVTRPSAATTPTTSSTPAA